jgi:hypothetical protein
MQRTVREFDELEDIVQYDLVLVMDAFDLQEVLKEVGLCWGALLGVWVRARARVRWSAVAAGVAWWRQW